MSQRTCTEEGCTRKYAARGMCALHYYRWRADLPADATTEDLRRRKPKPCSVEGCDEMAIARTWCPRHYKEWWLPQYRAKNPEAVRNWKLPQYGLTREDFDALLAAQGGVCPICQLVPKKPHVDHDHETGEVRGILCMHCNVALGHLRDDVERLRRAIGYLGA